MRVGWSEGARDGVLLHTPVEDAHGVVVGLRREVVFGVGLDLRYDGVVGGKVDVLDADGGWLVEVGSAFEDGFGVDGDGGPAVLGDGVVGGGGHGHDWGDGFNVG